ncbi:2-methylisocitrate lyase [Terrihabitans soli]|uniref:Methylisocitrate lyase n=1 Tax=Terrihabitans soli TaxID=708113 RepID=A0A6S6QW82_9HYPH|nr:methylisocitrate lyase [Terrihabitans soli]BCJ92187.1 2-methylisocitrate lyase [Terrihabitans soli]
MTVEWLNGKNEKDVSRAGRLRRLMHSGRAVAAAGAYDGMSAVLATNAGFEALYLSGAALSASMGLPDLGLITLDDVWRRAREISRVSNVPLIVDCDTGFGEALNIMRAVRELEEIGVACIHLEDQQFPKKCGHLNDKKLVSTEDMCRKIAAARAAANDMVICARTDAGATSFDDALDRAKRYGEAGAELIFVEALTTQDNIRRARAEIEKPLLANMTEFGRTPQISLSEWDAAGYNIVIYPVSAFRVASKAVQRFYASLRANGHVGEFLPEMMPRTELYETIQYYDYEALDGQIVKTVLEP